MRVNPNNLSQSEREFLIVDSYNNVKNKIIGFLAHVRTEENDMSGKYSVRLRDLTEIFNSNVWQKHKLRSGHVKFSHKVTGVTIGFSNHGNADPGAVETIADKLQKHVNILGNEILMYKKNNWSVLPDIKGVLENWKSKV